MKRSTRRWIAAAAAGTALMALLRAIPSPEPAPAAVEIRPAEGVFCAAGYDARRGILTLVFHNGYAYEFLGVPPKTAGEFLAAPRKGEFFNRHIRAQHASIRIARPPRPLEP